MYCCACLGFDYQQSNSFFHLEKKKKNIVSKLRNCDEYNENMVMSGACREHRARAQSQLGFVTSGIEPLGCLTAPGTARKYTRAGPSALGGWRSLHLAICSDTEICFGGFGALLAPKRTEHSKDLFPSHLFLSRSSLPQPSGTAAVCSWVFVQHFTQWVLQFWRQISGENSLE